ncbi:MAG: hypothetical protein COV45_01135 [Deltaproteobacteria bacterium CG11_big_fil_rev_8_21_14_0_20_47_16]|nr:MAG: hypothetical protein COV45_01135 [Deltaproteobacteria bacterium CG11_big_fil_rev_8_21_14_0_20_47_16]
MFIASVATAIFPYTYAQSEICDWYLKYAPAEIDATWVRGMFTSTQVKQRSFAIPLEEVVASMGFGVRNKRFRELAPKIITPLIHQALQDAGLSTKDVGALAAITSSGFLTPSLDADIINAAGLPTNTRRLPIVGLGCAAGVSGLAHATAWAKGLDVDVLVMVAAEFQSLTYLPSDARKVNVIGAALFADGAAVVVCKRNATKGWQVVSSTTYTKPETTYLMGWDMTAEGFGLILSEDVPSSIAKMAPKPLAEFLSRHDLTQEKVDHWILHPGGPKILEELAKATGLDGPVNESLRGLAAHGNMSSCSVLVSLAQFITQPAKKDEHTMMVSFGPGFSMEMLLLKYRG